MKFTEGAFKAWGYELAKDVYGAEDFQGGMASDRKRWSSGNY